MNVVTDALSPAPGLGPFLEPVAEPAPDPAVEATFAQIRAFYHRADVPLAYRLVAHDPGYLADLWGAACRAFSENRLSRRVKEALAFAVSVTTRSAFGTALHLAEMRRLGVGERGVMEVLGVTQMFSSYTKIADTLQLESDMRNLAPADLSPAPGGQRP